MIHGTTAGLDTFLAEIETDRFNYGFRASCPQIPGCVVVHRDPNHATALVRECIMAVALDGKEERPC